ncbi:hypothetical protein FBF72_40765 [Bradyrhizobium elkanii]|nr:hypothetical protein [Bradyrhizobium elkanii]
MATTSGPSIGWSRKFAKSRSSRRSGSASGSFGNSLTSFKPYQQVLPPFFCNLLPEGPACRTSLLAMALKSAIAIRPRSVISKRRGLRPHYATEPAIRAPDQ